MFDTRTPQWRDQYAGGLAPDPEVEAALSGAAYETVSFRPAPVPFAAVPSGFGSFVKLR
jgi:hypothetical protein